MAEQPAQAGFIFDQERRTIGFGSDRFRVILTPREIINALVKANHYSGTVNIGSAYHFGVYAPALVGGVCCRSAQGRTRRGAMPW